VTSDATVAELESLRGPLTGYCYRMLGAIDDVADAVQETMLRAYRGLDRYDPARASLSTWVHAIATNICLDMLRDARRRALPWDLGPAATTGQLGMPLPPSSWVEPMPDSRWLGAAADPADLAVARESVRLAFVAALQWLPPRQRAVLVLRDVLRFSAAETADIIGSSVASANSALQRARAALDEHRPAAADAADPGDPKQRELLRRYVRAFEAHDIDGLVGLLAKDVRSGMPPFAWWLDGPAAMATVMSSSDACDGDRLVPGVAASGSLTLGQYRPDQDGIPRPFALLVLELRESTVAQIVTFLGWGDRFADFDLPQTLSDEFRASDPYKGA
jgi:RNA polymerase sigma-70 factor (TIGR02960 family)